MTQQVFSKAMLSTKERSLVRLRSISKISDSWQKTGCNLYKKKRFLNKKYYSSKHGQDATLSHRIGTNYFAASRITNIAANITTTHRSFASTTARSNGNLAEVCNENVVSSPFPPMDPSSWKHPLPDFIMKEWNNKNNTSNSDEKNDLAILDGTTGMTRTFAQHYEDTAGIAESLRSDLNIDSTSCVCIFAPNHVDYLPVTLAVGLCGAKLTPVNPLYKANELEIVLQKSRSSVLIAHTSNLEIALEASKNVPGVKQVLVMAEDGETATQHGLETLESIKQQGQTLDQQIFHIDDPLTHPYLLPYSSGTTGLPKGVCLSHSNLTANLLQMDVVEGPQWNEGGLFSPLPFFHIYGLVVSLMYSGWKRTPLFTMSGKFDLPLMLDMIQKHKCNNAHLVPPILLALAKHPIIDQYDLSSLECIMSAASPLGVDVESAVQQRLKCNVKQAWGMSELSPIGTISPSNNIRVGSVGPVVSNTLGKIIDENGKSLGPQESGELVIRGPQVMLEYQDEPEQTANCKSDTGWLRTGDWAHYDEDGCFYITDRIKELIKVRGYQVAPAELEDLLLGHEHVNDVAVIQVPDAESGELPVAYIVLKEDAAGTDDEKTRQEIYNWVKERVAPYKRLDGGIIFVDSIPKSASGKILRRILRTELAEKLSEKAC